MGRPSERADRDVTAWLLLPVAAIAAVAWYQASIARLTPGDVPTGMRLFYPDSCLISSAFAALTSVAAFAVVSPFIERALGIRDDDRPETRRIQVVCLVLTAVLALLTYAQMAEAHVAAFGGQRLVVWTVTYEDTIREECDVAALGVGVYRPSEWQHYAAYQMPSGYKIVNMIGQGDLDRAISAARADGGLPD